MYFLSKVKIIILNNMLMYYVKLEYLYRRNGFIKFRDFEMKIICWWLLVLCLNQVDK